MLLQICILTIGIFLLYAGSCALVEGSVNTAIMFAVRPVIIGLTVVSFATSAPELLVSLVAALKGSGGISIGNILGSNVINIALVLGISAAIRPIDIKRQITRIDLPFLFIISAVFWFLCIDNDIDRMDGIILLGLLAVFLIYGIITAKDKSGNDAKKEISLISVLKNTFYIGIGIAMLALGAHFVVKEAIVIATKIGLSQTFIGISVVALGTSLPELATSAVAASKGESDISVGNVVGSNLFNICLVMGTVGLFNPMTIDSGLHLFQFPFMLFICFVLGGIAYRQNGINRLSGFTFVLLFFIYISLSYFI